MPAGASTSRPSASRYYTKFLKIRAQCDGYQTEVLLIVGLHGGASTAANPSGSLGGIGDCLSRCSGKMKFIYSQSQFTDKGEVFGRRFSLSISYQCRAVENMGFRHKKCVATLCFCIKGPCHASVDSSHSIPHSILTHTLKNV